MLNFISLNIFYFLFFIFLIIFYFIINNLLSNNHNKLLFIINANKEVIFTTKDINKYFYDLNIILYNVFETNQLNFFINEYNFYVNCQNEKFLVYINLNKKKKTKMIQNNENKEKIIIKNNKSFFNDSSLNEKNIENNFKETTELESISKLNIPLKYKNSANPQYAHLNSLNLLNLQFSGLFVMDRDYIYKKISLNEEKQIESFLKFMSKNEYDNMEYKFNILNILKDISLPFLICKKNNLNIVVISNYLLSIFGIISKDIINYFDFLNEVRGTIFVEQLNNNFKKEIMDKLQKIETSYSEIVHTLDKRVFKVIYSNNKDYILIFYENITDEIEKQKTITSIDINFYKSFPNSIIFEDEKNIHSSYEIFKNFDLKKINFAELNLVNFIKIQKINYEKYKIYLLNFITDHINEIFYREIKIINDKIIAILNINHAINIVDLLKYLNYINEVLNNLLQINNFKTIGMFNLLLFWNGLLDKFDLNIYKIHQNITFNGNIKLLETFFQILFLILLLNYKENKIFNFIYSEKKLSIVLKNFKQHNLMNCLKYLAFIGNLTIKEVVREIEFSINF